MMPMDANASVVPAGHDAGMTCHDVSA